MPAPTQPSDIAREVLRLFAARRLPPTPENFRTLYHEVSGTPPAEDAFPASFVRSIAGELPRDTPERTRLAKLLDEALAENSPARARQALSSYLDALHNEPQLTWNELIGALLRHWEARQLGWTIARKRESVERVLAVADPVVLHGRLQGLVRSWAQSPGDSEATPPAAARAATPEDGSPAATETPPPAVRLLAAGDAGEMLTNLRELLLIALEAAVPAFLADQPDLLHEAAALAASVRSAEGSDAFASIAKQMRRFAWRLEMAAGDKAERHAGLHNLFRLLLENIDQIVIDDQWLHGQVEVLREIVNEPADVRRIDDAERRLKEVIFKQSQLKHNLTEAQRSLKAMLADFVDQLAHLSETTGNYHDRIGDCARRITAARDIAEIGGVLDEVMRETRNVQTEAQRSRDELQAARQRASEAEATISALQRELDESSRQMRHDALTGVLNRRGFEESFERETARARRHRSPLCLALLDLDNFKKLNDTFGHETGDQALVHLADVVRENLRPQDTIARYGGEEFVLLYPDATPEQTQAALVRLQRELTRNFFLAKQNKTLITFSAGVTEWIPGETLEAAVKRADAAMYEAKRAGKNRVVISTSGT